MKMKKVSKMEKGGDLGMKSVKAGFDKNPGVTRADVIVAAKKEAKSGAKLKKQAAIAIAMKKAGKTPKKKMQYGGEAASMVPKGSKMMSKGGKAMYGKSMMKSGGKKKMMAGGKCKNGC